MFTRRLYLLLFVFAAVPSDCNGRKLYADGQNEGDDSLDCDDGDKINNPILVPYVLKLRGEEVIPRKMKEWVMLFDVAGGDPDGYFREEDGWRRTYLTEIGLGEKEEEIPFGRVYFTDRTNVYLPPSTPIADEVKEFKVMYAEQLLLDAAETVKIYVKYDAARGNAAKPPTSTQRLLKILTSHVHPKIVNVIAPAGGIECLAGDDNPFVALATCGSAYNRTMVVRRSAPKEVFTEDCFADAHAVDFEQSALPEFQVELPVPVKHELQKFMDWLLRRIGQRMHSYMESAFLKNRFQKTLADIYNKVNLQISKIKGGKTFAAAKSSLLMHDSLFDLNVYLNVTNTPYAFDKFGTINSYLHFIGRFTKWRLDTTKYAHFFEPLKELCTRLVASGNSLLRPATKLYEDEEGIFHLMGAICHEKILYVVNGITTMTTIKSGIYDNRKCNFDTVFVLAEKNITVNEDLSIPGKNLVIYAPVWFINKVQTIDLSGEDGSSAGESGQNGGDFFGFGVRFEKNHLLKVVSNGGNGNAGRNATEEVFDERYALENGGKCVANEASSWELWQEHGAILGGRGGDPGAVTIKMTKSATSNVTVVGKRGSAGADGRTGRLTLVCGNNERVVVQSASPREGSTHLASATKMNETEVMFLFRKLIRKNSRRLSYSMLTFYKDIWTSPVMGRSLDSTLGDFLADAEDSNESKELYDITSQILHSQIARTCNITDAQKVLLDNALAIIRMKTVEDGVLPSVIRLNEYLEASSRTSEATSELDDAYLREEEAKFRVVVEESAGYLNISLRPSLMRTVSDVHRYLQRNLKNYLAKDGTANDDKVQDYFVANVLFRYLFDIFDHIGVILNDFAEKDKAKLPESVAGGEEDRELDTEDIERRLYFFRHVRNNITVNEMKAMNGFLVLLKKILGSEEFPDASRKKCEACKEHLDKMMEKLRAKVLNWQFEEDSDDIRCAGLVRDMKEKLRKAVVAGGERRKRETRSSRASTQAGTFAQRLFCVLFISGCPLCPWRRDCVKKCQYCSDCSKCPWCVEKCSDGGRVPAAPCRGCADKRSDRCAACRDRMCVKCGSCGSKCEHRDFECLSCTDCDKCPECLHCPRCIRCRSNGFDEVVGGGGGLIRGRKSERNQPLLGWGASPVLPPSGDRSHSLRTLWSRNKESSLDSNGVFLKEPAAFGRVRFSGGLLSNIPPRRLPSPGVRVSHLGSLRNGMRGDSAARDPRPVELRTVHSRLRQSDNSDGSKYYGATFPREFREFERSREIPFLVRQFRSVRERERYLNERRSRILNAANSRLRGGAVGAAWKTRSPDKPAPARSCAEELASVKNVMNGFFEDAERRGCDNNVETKCRNMITVVGYAFPVIGNGSETLPSIRLNCPECRETVDVFIRRNNEEMDKCASESSRYDYAGDDDSACSGKKQINFNLRGCDPEMYSRASADARQNFLREFSEAAAADESSSNEVDDIKRNFGYLLANIDSFLQEGFRIDRASIYNFMYVTDSSKIFGDLKSEYKKKMSELHDFFEVDMYQLFGAELAMQNEKLGMIAKWINQMRKLVPWIKKVTDFLDKEPAFHDVTEKILEAVRLVSEIGHNLKIIERYRELRLYMKRSKGAEAVADQVRMETESVLRETILKDVYDKSVRITENSMFPLAVARAELKRLLLTAKNETYGERFRILAEEAKKFGDAIEQYTVVHEDIPIYEWKVRTRPSLLDDIAAGKPVILVSEILDGGRENSVAGKDFRLKFVADKRQTEQAQKEIDAAFAGLRLEFTHSGISYFKFGSRIYRRLTETVTFRQNGDGNGSEKRDIDFQLSPYTTWVLRMKIPRGGKSPGAHVKDMIGSIRLLGTVRYVANCARIRDVNQYFVPLKDYKRRNRK